MGLEAREEAAFGLQPDPAVLARTMKPHRIGEHEIPLIPSSQFVSDENARAWGWCTGLSKDHDTRLMALHEQRAFRREASRIAGTLIPSDPPGYQ